jgi:hypothetical protein
MAPLIADGGPAFPVPQVYDGLRVLTVPERGMSLRQWYAGQAMKGLLANTTFNHFSMARGQLAGGADAQDLASLAYQFADALIAVGATDEEP